MIDLSYLRQQAPAEYTVDAGDVLAIYIEQVLGQREQPPINQPLDTTQPPTLGYPLTVRDDGTLSLPLIQPINVRSKTIPQIERDIRYAYTVQRRLLLPGQDRILVTLHKPRQHRILVIRQETQSDVLTSVSVSGGSLGTAKKGTGHVVSLPAYKNDVLNALVASGGLPGLDAENVVYVMRGRHAQPAPALPLSAQPQPTQYQPPHGQPNPPMPPGYQQPPTYQQQPAYPQEPGYRQQPTGYLPQPGYGPMSSVSPAKHHSPSLPVDEGLIIRAQNPEMAQTLPRGRYNSGIQQVDYRMSRPQPVSGNLTALPMPTGSQSMMNQAYHTVADSNYQTASMQMVDPRMAPQFAPQFQPSQQFSQPMSPQFQPQPQQQWQQPANWANAPEIAHGRFCNQQNSIRIPLRLEEFETINFSESDIILEDGDIVFIASRDNELFYTGGLLGGGEYTLPRDRDLDILEAIAIAESRRNSGGRAGSSALNSDVSISPSEAIVLRKLPNGTQVPILVDLYRARTRASERINIQPGDYIIVQYTKMEAVGAFIERHILESALFGVAAAQLNSGRR